MVNTQPPQQPQFSQESLNVLRVLQQHGILRGFELQRFAELNTPQGLKDAVLPLVEHGLITASGPMDACSILRVQFANLPRAYAAAQSLLGSTAVK